MVEEEAEPSAAATAQAAIARHERLAALGPAEGGGGGAMWHAEANERALDVFAGLNHENQGGGAGEGEQGIDEGIEDVATDLAATAQMDESDSDASPRYPLPTAIKAGAQPSPPLLSGGAAELPWMSPTQMELAERQAAREAADKVTLPPHAGLVRTLQHQSTHTRCMMRARGGCFGCFVASAGDARPRPGTTGGRGGVEGGEPVWGGGGGGVADGCPEGCHERHAAGTGLSGTD